MKFDCKDFAVSLPYPVPKILWPNNAYANLLLEDYAGMGSEMTAITQYIYGHFVTEQEDLSESLRCISIVEMRHLDLLAETILKLGADPKFRTHSCGNWSPGFIQYSKTPSNIILDNIRGEKSAIAQYRKHIEMIDDPEITALLKRIILDEERHIEILSELYAQFG